MTEQRDIFYIGTVTSQDADDAFRFHQRVADYDSHIWPRSQAEIKNLADDRCLFGAWRGEERQLVALCYSTLDEDKDTWEVGGLCVDQSVRRRGIGTILVRFSLAHTMVREEPWANGQTIIAHVHQANMDPRKLLQQMGFEPCGEVEVPETIAPASMKRNAEGKIIGDVFEFTQQGLKDLSAWFDQDLDEVLEDMNLTFGLGVTSLEVFKTDLREISQNPGR